jgi:LuxR family maltose regulon positive regulatory protein
MQSAESRPINIYTLGRFDVVLDGIPLRFVFKAPRKPLVLLKALLSAGRGGVSQQALCQALWPEFEQSLAVTALYATVLRLRKLLGRKSALKVDQARVTLDPEHCWVDAWAFEHAVAEARDPSERACSAYSSVPCCSWAWATSASAIPNPPSICI